MLFSDSFLPLFTAFFDVVGRAFPVPLFKVFEHMESNLTVFSSICISESEF